ncbi:MAG: ATP-binding cassette domain-containing protein [Bacteroidia bacterium]|nr:ATP-binding cassette domain-containing protein [Bacteroidia bacterium]
MLHIQNVSFEFGGNYLFRDIDWFIKPRERIGLIGKNGAGKSTLLKLIMGKYDVREGSINKSGGINLGYLSQDMISEDGNQTILEHAKQAFKRALFIQDELEQLYILMETDPSEENIQKIADYQEEFDALDGYNIDNKTAEILEGLGFKTEDLDRPMKEFSGGWRMRVVLAKMLLEEPDIMLMDEPTNHLDLPSIEWLEGYLSSYPGSVVIVSHDREFLNKMINKTAELSNQKLYLWDGNYDFYLKAKVERDDLISRQAANQSQYIKEQEKFINRFKAKASKAKAVQSRIKMVDKIERIVEIDEDKSNLKIDFKVGKPSGKVVMDLNEIQQGFDNQILFDRVNREIVRGDKIALIGANGTGKSTFLSIIANEIDFEGIRKEGHQVISSFYAQHQLESLHLDYEILEELHYDAPHKTEMELRNMLGCFLFGGDDVFKKIKVLSGGEKARVSLAKTLVSEANFLLLDEPTNHLDIDSIEIIIEALKRYEGTLIFVSHNRYFIEKLANKVWWIEDQDVKEYPGNYSEYLYKVQQSQNPSSSDKAKKKGQKTVEDKSSKDSWKRKNEKEERIKKLQKKLDQIEEQIENSQNHLKNLEVKLSSIDVTKQEEYENISKEYADTTLRVNQLTKESEILIEEIISLE